jgi:predicted RNA-binding Zn-ribbon protein involved in translation (DUF1610 family)
MATSLPQTTISCTQCGGELHPDEGQIFLTCPYCSSAVYLDKSKVVFHWYLEPTLDENKARSSLARWMAGNETVKDLDKKAQVGDYAFEYFPVWYFKRRDQNGREQVLLEPAAATSISEIRNIGLPAGDLRKYEDQLGAEAVSPSVPLKTALEWLDGRGVPEEQIIEQSLVHIPLYTFKYTYQNQPYTAMVEAGTGGVFANIFPAKAEAPYMLAGCLTAMVFLCLALFPVIGGIFDGGAGAGIGLALCAGIGIVAAPILFALAAWVSAKI